MTGIIGLHPCLCAEQRSWHDPKGSDVIDTQAMTGGQRFAVSPSGHVGVRGNGRSDRLAGLATADDDIVNAFREESRTLRETTSYKLSRMWDWKVKNDMARAEQLFLRMK